MKKLSQRTCLRSATVSAKQRARRFLNAVSQKRIKVEPSGEVKTKSHVENSDFHLSESQVTFIQEQLKKVKRRSQTSSGLKIEI